MIDCFVPTVYLNDERLSITRRVVKFLQQHGDLRVTILNAGGSVDVDGHCVVHPKIGSHDRRYLLAECLATTNPYLLIDDDCLPMGDDWLEFGVETMINNPDIGLLGYQIYKGQAGDRHVFDVNAVGGMILVNRNCRTIPFTVELTGPRRHNDWRYSKAVRESGFRVCAIQGGCFEHLGKDCSTYG